MDVFSEVLRDFEGVTKTPEVYVSFQPELETVLTSCTKTLFDVAASNLEEHVGTSGPLTTLITEGFDEEQIWQELELQNRPCLDNFVKHVAKAVASRGRLSLQGVKTHHKRQSSRSMITDADDSSDDVDDSSDDVDGDEEENIDARDNYVNRTHSVKNLRGSQDLHVNRTRKQPNRNIESDDDDDESEGSDTNFDIDDLESRTRQNRKSSSMLQDPIKAGRNKNPSMVDDAFFRLAEMERFLEMEDAKEAKIRRQMEKGEPDNDESEDESGSEVSLDYFEDAPSDEGQLDDDNDDEAVEEEEPSTDRKSTRRWMYGDFFADPGVKKDGPAKKVHFERDEEEIEEDGRKGFDEESFEDADENLIADLRRNAGAKDTDDWLLSDSDRSEEGEDLEDILGGSHHKKGNPNKEDDGSKSAFEKRQEKLRQKIDELEQSNLADKSWQLIGEVGASKRPENSLLEETLEFDAATRPAPVITEETTLTLEEVIKQRVLDQAWDDVQRKSKPKEDAYEFKKRVTLDQEKSKMSLGEIYEQEYIKQTRQEAQEQKEDPQHTEIKDMMNSLFVKLDALTNFHYTPKPIMPEVKIISNAPAIVMEEVTPINVAEASLLAPEEVQEKTKGEMKGTTEKTATDRKHDLRKKKHKQRLRARERERREKVVAKMKPGLGNKYSKKAALAKLEKNSKAPSSNTTVIKDVGNDKSMLKSSKTFFSKLQEEVTAEVHGFKEKKKKKHQLSGIKLKM